ncbi:MAG TPA: hypothetical protein VK102_03560 [Sphingobacterium sp.]|nr:hypothetical protein [Sphingobacterium sp.]
MKDESKKQLRLDFEKYMRYCLQTKSNFSLEDFASFASTIINFSSSDKSGINQDKENKSDYLLQLYNAGLRNRITKEDLQELKTIILSDPGIDFEIINLLYKT